MTTRETWLLTGLVASLLLLAGLGFWQHVRYSDAEQAARLWVQLEGRIRSAPEEETAFLRQAHVELQRNMFRGEFAAALRRMEALNEEQELGGEPESTSPALTSRQLWPEGSAGRKRAIQVFRSITEKQKAGYDLETVQEALLRMAGAARSGKKEAALAALGEAERLLPTLRLRPGFSLPAAAAAAPGRPGAGESPRAQAVSFRGLPGSGGTPADLTRRSLRGVTEEQLTSMLQYFRTGLPLLRERATTEEQHRFLDRLAPFVEELGRAHRLGKDVAALAPLLQRLGAAAQQDDLRTAHRLLAEAQALLPGLPRRSAAGPRPARPGAGSSPSGTAGGFRRPEEPAGSGPPPPGNPPPRAARPPAVLEPPGGVPSILPGGPPAAGVSPPAGLPPLGPDGRPGVDGLLGVLDHLRKLPEPEYQRQRGRLGLVLGQVLLQNGRPAGAGGPGRRTAVGGPVRLELDEGGRIVAFWVEGRDLGRGGEPGGLVAVTPGGAPVPLTGAVRREGPGLIQNLSGSGGTLRVTYRPAPGGLQVAVEGRWAPGPEGQALQLRLPCRLAGWRLGDGTEAPLIAAEETRSVSPGDAGPLETLLTSGGRRLRLRATGVRGLTVAPGRDLLILDLEPAAVLRANLEMER
ncbi:MAG: hypothetical protein FJX77_00590 [Armatimonadetes bacterium]|nr:hypothetical protein [Armatimonadota bacterium]